MALLRILYYSQIVLAVTSLALFVWSFHAKEAIREQAKESIVVKITEGVNRQIDLVQALVSDPKLSENASLQVRGALTAIEAEIEHYRTNPRQYVLEVIDSDLRPPVLTRQDPRVANLLKGMHSWKLGIKDKFSESLANLLRDIRIFLMSNLVALGISAFLISRRKILGRRQVTISMLLTVVTAFSILLYLRQSWFWSIILNNYIGMGYPLLIAFLFFSWYFDYVRDSGLKTGRRKDLSG